MTLTNNRKRELRSRANQLKSIIRIGREGLTAPVLDMIRLALKKHELIKVRIHADDVRALAERLATEVPCDLIARTGSVAILHQADPDLPAPSSPPSD